MDIRSLRLFIHLAEELHFGRAAELSHLSPSAATRMLQRLESEFGVLLLERDRRRVAVTRSGSELLVYAREAVQQWELVQARLCAHQRQPAGRLRLFCSVTAAYSVLASILPQVRVRYPDIEIHLITGDQALAAQRVMEGREELAITAHPGQVPDALDFQTLSHSPLVCIAPRTPCQVTEQLAVGEADLAGVPLIVPESGLIRSRLENWFKTAQVVPQVYAYVSGHEAIVSLVALGFGLSVVPRIVIESSPLKEQVVIYEQGPELGSFEIGLIARRASLQESVVRVVWELAAEHSRRAG